MSMNLSQAEEFFFALTKRFPGAGATVGANIFHSTLGKLPLDGHDLASLRIYISNLSELNDILKVIIDTAPLSRPQYIIIGNHLFLY